jgi:hypothetical protein
MAMNLRPDPGLAASPRLWHITEVERGGGRATRPVPCVPFRKRRRGKFGSSGWLAGEDRVQRILMDESLVGGHGPR